jgi:serine phosphatase RsbU (regulator of sigma subunit)
MTAERTVFGLRAKFSLWVTVFIILVMVGADLYFTSHERNAIKAEMELRGVAIARSVAAASETPLTSDDDLLLAENVHKAQKDNKGVVYCFITDAASIIVAHNDISMVKKPYTPPRTLPPSRTGLDYFAYSYKTARGELIYHIATPITIRQKLIGTVHLGLSQETIRQTVAGTQKKSIVFTLIIIALGILATLVGVTFISRPLEQVTRDIIAIGEGDLDRPIEVRGRDEIGKIGSAVREMARRLKQAQVELVEKERMEKELEIAQEIQRAILPQSLPQFKGYEIEAFYRPSRELSGDYYDAFLISGDHLGLVIADVSGKGVGGSLITMMLKGIIRRESQDNPLAKNVVTTLHQLLKADIPEGSFVTLFYGVLEAKTDQINLCSAGHNPPILYRRDEDRVEFLQLGGLPLGLRILGSKDYAIALKVDNLVLKSGDLLVLYTDGITEARNSRGEMFGEGRFLTLVKENGRLPLKAFKEEVARAVEEFTRGLNLADDIAFLVLKKT